MRCLLSFVVMNMGCMLDGGMTCVFGDWAKKGGIVMILLDKFAFFVYNDFV